MDFKECLAVQFRIHPSMQPQDVVKMCYQAAFGAEHLLEDVNAAREYFFSEYESVPARNISLYEEISPDFCRVNLSAWKAKEFPADLLFELFCRTAATPHGSKELMLEYLSLAEELVNSGKAPFTAEKWHAYVDKYINDGMKAVHHSQEYREKECPSYRIISTRLLSLVPLSDIKK